MSKADKAVNTARAQIDLTNGIMQTPRLRVEFRDRFDPAGNQSHSLQTETVGAKRFAIRILTQRWVRQATFRESDVWQSPVKAGESQASVVWFLVFLAGFGNTRFTKGVWRIPGTPSKGLIIENKPGRGGGRRVVSNFCGLVLASKYRQRLEGRDKPNCFLDLGPFSG